MDPQAQTPEAEIVVETRKPPTTVKEIRENFGLSPEYDLKAYAEKKAKERDEAVQKYLNGKEKRPEYPENKIHLPIEKRIPLFDNFWKSNIANDFHQKTEERQNIYRGFQDERVSVLNNLRTNGIENNEEALRFFEVLTTEAILTKSSREPYYTSHYGHWDYEKQVKNYSNLYKELNSDSALLAKVQNISNNFDKAFQMIDIIGPDNFQALNTKQAINTLDKLITCSLPDVENAVSQLNKYEYSNLESTIGTTSSKLSLLIKTIDQQGFNNQDIEILNLISQISNKTDKNLVGKYLLDTDTLATSDKSVEFLRDLNDVLKELIKESGEMVYSYAANKSMLVYKGIPESQRNDLFENLSILREEGFIHDLAEAIRNGVNLDNSSYKIFSINRMAAKNDIKTFSSLIDPANANDNDLQLYLLFHELNSLQDDKFTPDYFMRLEMMEKLKDVSTENQGMMFGKLALMLSYNPSLNARKKQAVSMFEPHHDGNVNFYNASAVAQNIYKSNKTFSESYLSLLRITTGKNESEMYEAILNSNSTSEALTKLALDGNFQVLAGTANQTNLLKTLPHDEQQLWKSWKNFNPKYRHFDDLLERIIENNKNQPPKDILEHLSNTLEVYPIVAKHFESEQSYRSGFKVDIESFESLLIKEHIKNVEGFKRKFKSLRVAENKIDSLHLSSDIAGNVSDAIALSFNTDVEIGSVVKLSVDLNNAHVNLPLTIQKKLFDLILQGGNEEIDNKITKVIDLGVNLQKANVPHEAMNIILDTALQPEDKNTEDFNAKINRVLKLAKEIENIGIPREILVDIFTSAFESDSGIVNAQTLIKILTTLNKTTSKELKKFSAQVVNLLKDSQDPLKDLESIQNVFERNNLPDVGKIYRVFEILHPIGTIGSDVANRKANRKNGRAHFSPVLSEASDKRQYDIFYRDLLKVHIESSNPSLYKYLKTLESGQNLVDKIETEGVNALDLNTELPQVIRFLNRMDTLFQNSLFGRRTQQSATKPVDIQERIKELERAYNVKPGGKLSERVAQMFIKPVGYASINEVILKMESVKQNAHERNKDYFQKFELKAEDLLKGTHSNFLELQLQDGVVSKEFLGVDASSDTTPFDTDVSKVLADHVTGKFRDPIASSLVGSYGDIVFVFKDRGEFQKTKTGEQISADPNKYELFYTGYHGSRHYGIRTGIGASEIDAIVNQSMEDKDLKRVFFTISQNGFYIPVFDMNGKILFTPEMFEEYRLTENSLQEFFQGSDKSPNKLIEGLKKSPYIKKLFEGSVGVWEGYTLEEHTKMVLGQYEKYFSGKWKSPLISEDEFRILLALHDIGKPLGVEMTGNTKSQHEYSMKFLPRLLEGIGIQPSQADLIKGVVSGDYLGEYIQGHKNLEETGRIINMKAKECGVPVDQFFQLLKMYYLCDASAYTTDAGGKASLDSLFIFNHKDNSVTLEGSVEEKVAELSPYLYLE